MTQLLSEIYKLVRTASSADLDPFNVYEEKSSQFSQRPIHAREDSLVVYGPHEAKSFEIVLLKPIESNSIEAYSLYRTANQDDAEEIFIVLKDKLPFLVEQQKTCTAGLIKKFSDVIRNNPGWHLTHIIVQLGIKNLISHPEVLKQMNEKCVHTGITPFQVAVETKQVVMIQSLLDVDVNIDILDGNGNSIFHYAAKTNKEIVELISKKTNETINAVNNDGQSPLHVACLQDKPDCVQALLRAGAEIRCTMEQNRFDEPNNENIIIPRKKSTCEIIDSHPNQLDIVDMKHGGTPLHWAKSVAVLEAFIEAGCDIDAQNFYGNTALHVMVHRDRLSCVICLLSNGASFDIKGSAGNTPLHLAVKLGNVSIIEALIVFGANVNAVNDALESPRHVAATTEYSSARLTSFISNSVDKEKNGAIVYILHTVGARRCNFDDSVLQECNEGCSKDGSFDGIVPETNPFLATDNQLFNEILGTTWFSDDENKKKKLSVLCLDGGGIRGLILIKMLMMIEEIWGISVIRCFDWIAGTSTGGILALGLAIGKSTSECLALYFRLKSKVFKGNRPYDSNALEEFLKSELGGDEMKMTDLKSDPKVMVTGVLADRLPAALHLFRNYASPLDILQEAGIEMANGEATSNSNPFIIPPKPQDQPVWLAGRATGAAPTYFKASGNIVDGGLIANNPTLDLLTEIHEYNKALEFVNKKDEIVEIGCVVSLGTGRLPVVPVNDIDVWPDSWWTAPRAVRGMGALANLLVEQATSSDGQIVKRAKAWCNMINTKYIRLNPSLASNIAIDETGNEKLVHMLWETMVYMNQQKETLLNLKRLLHDRMDCS